MNPLTPRELIDAVKSLPAKGLLRDLGFTLTSRDTRFYPCPACNAAPAHADRHKRGVAQVVNNAAFYCYRCCTGGSTLDILLLRHGLDPKRMDDAAYACMRDYLGEAPQSLPERLQTPPVPEKPPLFTHRQVQRWYGGMCRYTDIMVRCWLQERRGLPHRFSGDWGCAMGERFLPSSRPDLREAAAAGPCAAFPLYSMATGEICNVVIRPLTPFLPPGQSKPWKARTLNAGANTTRDGGLPLVYGNPNAVKDPSMIVVVEGALDQLTALAMSPPDVLVLGAFCADDIPLLAPWCRQQTVPIVLVPHLDEMQTRCPQCRNGWAKVSKRRVWENFICDCGTLVETRRVGQDACRALWEACLKPNRARGQAMHILNWDKILDPLRVLFPVFQASGRSDLNDLVRRDMGDSITTIDRLTPIWRSVLEAI